MGILETRRELNELAEQYPMSTVGTRNGGWYMLYHDDTVLAVASDSVCEELDASVEKAMQLYGLLPELGSEVGESVAPRSGEQLGPELSNSCCHPRCFASSACRTQSVCYVCEWNLNICIWVGLSQRRLAISSVAANQTFNTDRLLVRCINCTCAWCLFASLVWWTQVHFIVVLIHCFSISLVQSKGYFIAPHKSSLIVDGRLYSILFLWKGNNQE